LSINRRNINFQRRCISTLLAIDLIPDASPLGEALGVR
jgi:hypothetical protein